MNRGGFALEDNVLIDPKENFIATNHPIESPQRKSTRSKLILIRENAWIGVNATVMPGVAIGKISLQRPARLSLKMFQLSVSWRACRQGR